MKVPLPLYCDSAQNFSVGCHWTERGRGSSYPASCHLREDLISFLRGLSKLTERENQLAKEFCQRAPRVGKMSQEIVAKD